MLKSMPNNCMSLLSWRKGGVRPQKCSLHGTSSSFSLQKVTPFTIVRFSQTIFSCGIISKAIDSSFWILKLEQNCYIHPYMIGNAEINGGENLYDMYRNMNITLMKRYRLIVLDHHLNQTPCSYYIGIFVKTLCSPFNIRLCSPPCTFGLTPDI